MYATILMGFARPISYKISAVVIDDTHFFTPLHAYFFLSNKAISQVL